MKLIVVAVAALVAFTMAAPVEEKKYPVVIRSEFEQKLEGAYVYNFETENGIVKQEVGELKEVKDEENIPHQVVVVRGQYSYPGDDGKPVVVSYFADETGYHPEGDSIPKV